MTMIQLHSQDHSRTEAVDYDALMIGDAEPTNMARVSNAWVAEARSTDGEAESVAAGDDPGELPWDADHVVRITCKD